MIVAMSVEETRRVTKEATEEVMVKMKSNVNLLCWPFVFAVLKETLTVADLIDSPRLSSSIASVYIVHCAKREI